MVKIDIPGGDEDDKSQKSSELGASSPDAREVDYRCESCGGPVYTDEPAILVVGEGMACRICTHKKSPHQWWKRLA